MAKNPEVQTLFDDDDRIDIPETDLKYTEIKDKKMPLPRRGIGFIASPINCDKAHVSSRDRHINRHTENVLRDENVSADRDAVPCPTCRGTGAIHEGINKLTSCFK